VIQTFNDQLEKLALQRLDASIEAEKEVMSQGGLKDHADYRYHAGVIKGLRIAKEINEVAVSDIQKQK
jgi:hypothetical protein